MGSFIGRHSVNLDGKGRITIPSSFRAIIKEEYNTKFMIVEKDGYLILFPKLVWKNEKEKQTFAGMVDGDRETMRDWFPMMIECEIKSDKILIPPEYRKSIGIAEGAKLKVLGMDNSIEVWSEEEWSKYVEERKKQRRALEVQEPSLSS